MDATTSVARLLVPSRAERIYNRACAHFAAGKYEQAEKEIQSALQIHPEYGDALTLRGMLELRKPDLESGRESLEQAIKIDPSQSTAYIALAAVYNHQGRFDDAMRVSEKVWRWRLEPGRPIWRWPRRPSPNRCIKAG